MAIPIKLLRLKMSDFKTERRFNGSMQSLSLIVSFGKQVAHIIRTRELAVHYLTLSRIKIVKSGEIQTKITQ